MATAAKDDVLAELTPIERMLDGDPAAAEATLRNVLRRWPGEPRALLMLGGALRRTGRATAAAQGLRALTRAYADWAAAWGELGEALAVGEAWDEAAAAAERAVALRPELADGWRLLGDARAALGDMAGADAAYMRGVAAGRVDPALTEAALAMGEDRLAVAERTLRGFLARHPSDVAGMRMLAEIAGRLGRNGDAIDILRQALALAPSFRAARENLMVMLHRHGRAAETLAQAERLLADTPGDLSARNLKAAALAQTGEYADAATFFEALTREQPRAAKLWLSYGHVLKTLGRRADCEAAYARAVALEPSLGEAWWSIANLKDYPFGDEDLAAMRARLGNAALSDEDRLHFHFTLGKALEDRRDWAASWTHYAEGNRLRRAQLRYRAGEVSDFVDEANALFTRDFFAARAGWGCPTRGPVFIVGLPRAGSTLLEQMLGEHSLIEGTMELPELGSIATRLGGKTGAGDDGGYPAILAELSQADCRALGEEYLARTRVYRKTDKPLFLDKMPNNWAHIGLLRLILPNARVINARRGAMANGFAAFKQHFARGQGFTYSLSDVGRYWRDYARHMAHLDSVLPGHVHQVRYERLVADAAGELRAALAWLGVAWEPGCLEFHKSDRPVRTASSEQVRRPISAGAVEHWRHYERWLGPLKDAIDGAG